MKLDICNSLSLVLGIFGTRFGHTLLNYEHHHANSDMRPVNITLDFHKGEPVRQAVGIQICIFVYR